jgi:hypothetical protein
MLRNWALAAAIVGGVGGIYSYMLHSVGSSALDDDLEREAARQAALGPPPAAAAALKARK